MNEHGMRSIVIVCDCTLLDIFLMSSPCLSLQWLKLCMARYATRDTGISANEDGTVLATLSGSIFTVSLKPTLATAVTRPSLIEQFYRLPEQRRMHKMRQIVITEMSRLPLLEQIPEPNRGMIASQLTIKTYAVGDTIFRQNDVAQGFYIIIKGSVDIHVRGKAGAVRGHVRRVGASRRRRGSSVDAAGDDEDPPSGVAGDIDGGDSPRRINLDPTEEHGVLEHLAGRRGAIFMKQHVGEDGTPLSGNSLHHHATLQERMEVLMHSEERVPCRPEDDMDDFAAQYGMPLMVQRFGPIVATLAFGDSFGEAGHMKKEPRGSMHIDPSGFRGATVIASSPVVLGILSIEDYSTWVGPISSTIEFRPHAQHQLMVKAMREKHPIVLYAVLRHFTTLAGMSNLNVQELCGHAEYCTFDPATKVFKEGGAVLDHVYIIYRGKVELRVGELVLATLGVGSSVGEGFALLDCPPQCSALCVTTCHLVAIPRWVYDRYWRDVSITRELIGSLRQSYLLRSLAPREMSLALLLLNKVEHTRNATITGKRAPPPGRGHRGSSSSGGGGGGGIGSGTGGGGKLKPTQPGDKKGPGGGSNGSIIATRGGVGGDQGGGRGRSAVVADDASGVGGNGKIKGGGGSSFASGSSSSSSRNRNLLVILAEGECRVMWRGGGGSGGGDGLRSQDVEIGIIGPGESFNEQATLTGMDGNGSGSGSGSSSNGPGGSSGNGPGDGGNGGSGKGGGKVKLGGDSANRSRTPVGSNTDTCADDHGTTFLLASNAVAVFEVRPSYISRFLPSMIPGLRGIARQKVLWHRQARKAIERRAVLLGGGGEEAALLDKGKDTRGAAAGGVPPSLEWKFHVMKDNPKTTSLEESIMMSLRPPSHRSKHHHHHRHQHRKHRTSKQQQSEQQQQQSVRAPQESRGICGVCSIEIFAPGDDRVKDDSGAYFHTNCRRQRQPQPNLYEGGINTQESADSRMRARTDGAGDREEPATDITGIPRTMDEGGWERHGNTPLQSAAGGLSLLTSAPADAAVAIAGGRDEREDELVLYQQSFAMKNPGPTTRSPGPPSPIMSAVVAPTNVHHKEVKASHYPRAVLTTSSVLVNEPAPTTGRFSLPSKSPRAASRLMSSSAGSRGGGGGGGGGGGDGGGGGGDDGGRRRMLDGRRAAGGGGGGKIRLATKRHLTRTMSPHRPAAGDASAALVAKGGPRCWVQQPTAGKPRGSGFRTAHAVSRPNERRDQGAATPCDSTDARPTHWDGGAVYNVEEAAAVAAVTVGGMNEEAALAMHAPRYHWPVRKIQTAHTNRGRARVGSSPSSVDTRGGITSPRSSALAPWGKTGGGGGVTPISMG